MTTESQSDQLEQALQQAEQEADVAVKAAEKVVKGLRQLKQSAHTGQIRKLRAAASTVQEGFSSLERVVDSAVDAFQFDEESYLRDGSYTRELLKQAQIQGLPISEQDERLYSYPMLIALDLTKRAVLIDRVAEDRLRPSVLVGILQDRKKRPVRFKPADFLKSLYAAYCAVAPKSRDGRRGEPVIPLRDLYDILTLLPGSAKEYSRPEFARDLYLLDQTGQLVTKENAVGEFHASTGTKGSSKILSAVTESGVEKRYYGISFSVPPGE